ncbi:hypothetical protein [Clostridium sp.]|uniref:hypothetical protein n=1 Tax=Clostridium sp. TaxID=1506 RepID=UPI003F41159A
MLEKKTVNLSPIILNTVAYLSIFLSIVNVVLDLIYTGAFNEASLIPNILIFTFCMYFKNR